MASMGLGGGFAAGGGADALETLLARLFTEGQAKIRNRQAQQQIDQDERRLTMAAEDRDATRADMANAREQSAVKGMLTMTPKGTNFDPETAARVRGAGFGANVLHEQADLPSRAISGGVMAGAKAPIVGQLRMSQAGRPERDTFTGTAEQLAGEQTRQDTLANRAAAAAEREQARLDRIAAAEEARTERARLASEAQAGRKELAIMAAGQRGANADLQREILQGKIDAAKDKTTQAQQTADNARNAALASIDDTSSALDELLDEKGQLKPGATGAFGADSMLGIIPGTSYADAKARRDRLESRLTIDLLGEMKRQSRTGASGFGALSEKELAVLQSAAARLGAAQSDESARQALIDVRKQLAGMRSRVPGSKAATGGGAPTAPAADDAAAKAAALIKKYGGG